MQAFATGIRKQGVGILPWSRSLRSWQARVTLLARHRCPGGPWPDVCDDTLTDTLEEWLAPFLYGRSRLSDLTHREFARAVQNLLGRRQRQDLEPSPPRMLRCPVDRACPLIILRPPPSSPFAYRKCSACRPPPPSPGTSTAHFAPVKPFRPAGQITRDLRAFGKTDTRQ